MDSKPTYKKLGRKSKKSEKEALERKRTMKALHESEEKFNVITATAKDAIIIMDNEGNISYWNEAAEKMFGYSAHDALGKEMHILLAPLKYHDAYKKGIRKFKTTGRGVAVGKTLELEAVRKDGTIFPVELSVSAVKVDEKWHATGIIRDITQRKETEESLRESENSYRTLSQNLPGIVYRVFLRENNRMKFFNDMLQPMTGFRANELVVGEVCSIDPLILPEDRAEIIATIKNAIAHNQPFEVEYRLRHKEGGIRYFLERGRPLRGKEGNPLYIDGVILDITKRKQVEEALRESEEKYRIISGAAQDAIVMMDNQGNISYWNPAAERIFGYKPEEAIGKELHLLLGPQRYHQAYKRGFKKFRETGQGAVVGKTLELSAIRKDGTEFPIELSVAGIQIKGTWHATGIIRDITERKEAEEALRKAHDELEHRVEERTAELIRTNEQLRMEIEERKRMELEIQNLHYYNRGLIETSLDPMVTFDQNGIILDVNKATIRATGRTRAELIGTPFADYFTDPGKAYKGVMLVFKTGEVRDYELVMKAKGGNEIIVAYNASVYGDQTGQVVGAFAAARDITKLKWVDEALRKSEKELRILSAQLLAAQEKERERVAHELHDSVGQALTAIKFRVENTLGQLDKTPARGVIESLEAVVPMVQYATEEVRRIAMGLRPSTLDDFGLLATINWFCREFQHIYSMIHIKKLISIEENEVPEHLKTVIYRIVQESLNNVAKHSNADLVRLSIGKRNSAIELVIKDNGLGFDLEDTLSSETSGKRLGLSSMKKRTEISGGVFAVESKIGGGTIIRALWLAN
jgi:PAS domain S-box-containing protein